MKALVGSWDHRPYRLLAEVTALRARVAQLQAELDRVRAENDRLAEAVHEEDVEVALSR
jgi:regulator of replication initiation timing